MTTYDKKNSHSSSSTPHTNLTNIEDLSLSMTYWNSPEARNLFAPSLVQSRTPVEEVLTRRIKMLQNVNIFPEGWRDILMQMRLISFSLLACTP
jgi:hypothetical protein